MDQVQFEDLTSLDGDLSYPEIARQLRTAIKPYKAELGSIGNKLDIVENADYLSLKCGSATAAQIRLRKNGIGLWIRNSDMAAFPEFAWIARSNERVMTILPNINSLLDLSYRLCELAVKLLPIGEGFGCCHRYVQCSDAKRCIHPENLVAMACAYRLNLERGKIFYGKNRNI